MFPTRIASGSRSVWKLPYTPAIANLREHAESKKPIKTMERSADIIPAWKGLIFAVHTGKTYKQVQITEEMIGHKLGEFAHTRKEFTFRQTKNKGR